VEYLDLLIDVRVMPDGTVRVEDEEEVEEAARSGLLFPAQLDLVERTRRQLLRDHARIVDDALRQVG
jgi:predicted RNA-binding protein associated with RNAse of E/G family